MKQIIFKAPVGKILLDNQEIVIDKYSSKELKNIINNIDSAEDFTDYLDKLNEKLWRGYMTFEVEDITYVITTYDVREPLTTIEIEYLKEYTQGQWSDGIGENFEQEPCAYLENKAIFISPWFPNQQIITIIE